MPECLPFRGWLYNLSKVKPEEVLAPPYDIVTPEEIAFYKNKSPYNIFHLELPETPHKAKELLEKFIKEEIFLQNGIPTIYYHELLFTYKEKSYTRRGFIVFVEISPFEEGKIIPHERIYERVTKERLELLKATHFQFSQIYGLYEDKLLYTLKLVPSRLEYSHEVKWGSEIQRLAKITDSALIKEIVSFLEDKKIFIADGHHRYNTALRYKAYMEERFGKEKNRAYNYVSIYLTPFEDENLLMLPTHRLYKVEDLKGFLKELQKVAELLEEREFENEEEEVFEEGRGDLFALLYEGKLYFFQIKKEIFERIRELEPELSLLPLFNFLKIFEELYGIKEEVLKERGEVEFLAEEKEVYKKAKGPFVGILFPRVSPLILKEVALKGKVMPHKSTYFYPKILTGLVLAEVSERPVK